MEREVHACSHAPTHPGPPGKMGKAGEPQLRADMGRANTTDIARRQSSQSRAEETERTASCGQGCNKLCNRKLWAQAESTV